MVTLIWFLIPTPAAPKAYHKHQGVASVVADSVTTPWPQTNYRYHLLSYFVIIFRKYLINDHRLPVIVQIVVLSVLMVLLSQLPRRRGVMLREIVANIWMPSRLGNVQWHYINRATSATIFLTLSENGWVCVAWQVGRQTDKRTASLLGWIVCRSLAIIAAVLASSKMIWVGSNYWSSPGKSAQLPVQLSLHSRSLHLSQ